MKSNKKWPNLHQKYFSFDNKMVNHVWRYFKKNGLGYYDKWIEQLSAYRLWSLMDTLVFKSEKEYSLEEIQEELRNIKSELKILHNYFKDNDDKNGEETYGYYSKESIRTNFMYISDRWGCQFRLRWLIDFLDIDLSQVKEKNND